MIIVRSTKTTPSEEVLMIDYFFPIHRKTIEKTLAAIQTRAWFLRTKHMAHQVFKTQNEIYKKN